MDSVLYLDYLRRLNRRQEAPLIGMALGNAVQSLDDGFKAQVKSRLGLDVPDGAFVAFDYQLSWLYAAAVLSRGTGRAPYPAGGGIDRGNQETIDLAIAWPEEEDVILLLIEAVGVTGWSGKQLLSKALWLGDLFGFDAAAGRWPGLRPHFAIASPSAPPADMQVQEWPEWMQGVEGPPAWLRMHSPPGLLKVTRTTQDGAPRANGGYWIVEGA